MHLPGKSKVSIWLREALDHLQPSEDAVLIATATVVGLGTGLGAIFLQFLIDKISWFGFDWLPETVGSIGKSYVIIVPTLGGLVVGFLVQNFAREAKGHGVPEVMEAIALRGGRIRPIVGVVKSVASAFTIGSGGSSGREGPIVQIGSAMGSTLGQALHLSEERIRNLVACGAAGGIAAAFNAPIAGVIFAIEIIIGELSVRYFSTVVISALIASIISRVAFGEDPAFHLPMEYGVRSHWEYAIYPVLGVLSAVVGVLYVRGLYFTEDVFDEWKRIPDWVKPAIGGALFGLLALVYPSITGVEWDTYPQIFGVGYEMIEDALSNGMLIKTALVIMFLKLVITSLTLGSGGSGGIFAPGLFMGAMLGSAFAVVMREIFPDIIAEPGAYALLGMAAVFAAAAHAPMTAIIILSELTNDHRIILPLMLTVTVATLLARAWLNKESIYTLKLSRRGVYLQRGQDIDLMQGVTVEEAMVTPPPTIEKAASLPELKNRFRALNTRALCTVDGEGQLLGIVTLGDLQEMYEQCMGDPTVDISDFTVGDICIQNPATVYSDDVLWTAIRTMGARDIGQLPVLKSSTRRLVGMVSRNDVMHAYNVAVAYKLRDQHRAEQMRLNILTGAHVVDMDIAKGTIVVGKKLQELALPEGSLVATITRKGKLIIPHGYTELLPGDRVTVVTEPSAEETLKLLFTAKARAEEAVPEAR